MQPVFVCCHRAFHTVVRDDVGFVVLAHQKEFGLLRDATLNPCADLLKDIAVMPTTRRELGPNLF